MFRKTPGTIAFVALAACSSPHLPEVDYTGLDNHERPYAEQAWDALLTACPHLVRYADDITSVTAKRAFSWVPEYQVENYGWDSVLTFVVAVADDPDRIPVSAYAAGHTLYYNVGSGVQPGVESAKPQARFLCDGEEVTDRGSNWFKPVAQMSVLGNVKPQPVLDQFAGDG